MKQDKETRALRASRARVVLDEPILKEAVEALRARYIEAMLQDKITDAERKDFANKVNALASVFDELEGYVKQAAHDQRPEVHLP